MPLFAVIQGKETHRAEHALGKSLTAAVNNVGEDSGLTCLESYGANLKLLAVDENIVTWVRAKTHNFFGHPFSVCGLH